MDLFDEPLECPIKAALLRVSPPLRMITAPSVAKVNVGAVLWAASEHETAAKAIGVECHYDVVGEDF